MKGINLYLFAAAASGLAAQANAQDAPVQSNQATTVDDQVPAGDQIIVTAQRREQALEDVPISMAVLSSDSLERSGIDSLYDIAKTAPAVSLTKVSLYTTPTIRGIGSSISGPGADPNVAMYVDGFYMPSRTGSQLMSFNNIEQVEVLKGPQGTLFGRNSTGGAILIKTLDPSFTTSAKLSASYARFDDRIVNGYVTTGLTDELAADLAVHYRKYGGYIKDIDTGANSAPIEELSLRSKFLLRLSDDTKITFFLEHGDVDDASGIVTTTYQYSIAEFLGYPTTSEKNRATGHISNRALTNAIGMKAEIGLGDVTLNSLTGYRRQKDIYRSSDGDFSKAVDHTQIEDTYSQELNLSSSSDGRLSWVTGVYFYYDSSAYVNRHIEFVFGNFDVSVGVKTTAIAAFADSTYEVADNVFLTAGARYNYETKKFRFEDFNSPLTAGTNPLTDSQSWGNFTPRANVRWEFAPRTNVYASISRGAKSGVYNSTVIGPTKNSVAPETVTAYEVGFKTAQPDWRLSAATYYYDYKNLQDLAFAIPASTLSNVASARIYGAELDFTYYPTENLTFRAAGAWTHARYVDFPNAVITLPSGDLLANVPVDLSGARMPRQADFTGNIDLNYAVPTSFGKLEFGANAYFSSAVPYSADRRLEQPAYATLNLQASWSSSDEHLRLSLFGTNVTNTEYRIGMNTSVFGDNQLFAEPASYGARIEVKY